MQEYITPNWVAIAVLFLWPLICLFFYYNYPLGRATVWSVLGGQLVLPVGLAYKIPMLPQIDKPTVANIGILACCIIFGRHKLLAPVKKYGIAEVLILLFVIGPLITSELNGDNITIGERFLPGVGIYDGISAAIAALIFLIPFYIGRRILRRPEDIKDLFKILVITQVIYTVPMLFEVRFSPQLHDWFYGYSPAQFLQSIRFGGFRPMVFMGHGLEAALFLMMSILAAAALCQSRLTSRKLGGGTFAYLSVVLVLCKSVAATIYAAILAPVIFFAKPRLQMNVALLLVSVAVLFPILRTIDLFPTNLIVSAANTLSPERAQSLSFRFENEDRLLARALERPAFGWGRYGRSRVFDEDTGSDLSITDGRWIITLGQFGFFGFIAEFGLLSIGVLRARRASRITRSTTDKILIATLSLLVAINMIDLLPNSGIVPWTLLLAGALLGQAEASQVRRLPIVNATSFRDG